ncbi:MAG: type II toxin-antitoxin system RelB/DinJ family antitoxin [Propionibacteriaceae bacterium]|jgi:DNA-damage-inducible protein J|nr:type II toxin-antitoxin system RelB/DinJ family antitoxin [Propionibacteriaceae bacterium]
MTDSVNVSIRMDRQLKTQADAFFAELGLTMSSAVGIFVRQCLIKDKIPFSLEADPFYSEANQSWLRESIAQAERGEFAKVTTLGELEAALK